MAGRLTVLLGAEVRVEKRGVRGSSLSANLERLVVRWLSGGGQKRSSFVENRTNFQVTVP